MTAELSLKLSNSIVDAKVQPSILTMDRRGRRKESGFRWDHCMAVLSGNPSPALLCQDI
jgi:hypothetical protein